jgi:predicted esterase
MRMRLRILLPGLALTLLSAGILQAQEPAPGRMSRRVSCGPSGQYSYSCYLPSAYDPSKKWPIMYCFDPNADGPQFVYLYKDVCEEVGWILVASNDSKNGPTQTEAIKAMWEDTHKRFSILPKDVFATGWSGGARVANKMSRSDLLDPKAFKGLSLIGGAYCGRDGPRTDLAVWLMCGETDFNRREMEKVKKELDQAGAKCELRIYPGGHVLPPKDVARDAVLWLNKQRAAVGAEAIKRGLEKARAIKDEDPYGAVLILEELLKEWPGEKELSKVRKELGSLKRDKRVKKERMAARDLKRARDYERSRNSKRYAKQIISRYRKVVKKYPGTHAAKEAAARIRELETE